MNYVITNATAEDLPVIYDLFEKAIKFLQVNKYVGWKTYDKEFIKTDILQGGLFKIIQGDEIACIFSVCFRDELIWREKEKGNAIYLHRIVVNRQYAGENLFQKVLDESTAIAKKRGLQYIRMDTWAENHKIVSYYEKYGFTFVENYTTPGTANLPEQHRNLHVALLERRID